MDVVFSEAAKNTLTIKKKPVCRFQAPNYSMSFLITGSADSEMSEEQKKEKLSELRKKEKEIQDILAKKTKELKKICLREAVRICAGLLFIFTVTFSERPHSFRSISVMKCLRSDQVTLSA